MNQAQFSLLEKRLHTIGMHLEKLVQVEEGFMVHAQDAQNDEQNIRWVNYEAEDWRVASTKRAEEIEKRLDSFDDFISWAEPIVQRIRRGDWPHGHQFFRSENAPNNPDAEPTMRLTEKELATLNDKIERLGHVFEHMKIGVERRYPNRDLRQKAATVARAASELAHFVTFVAH